LPVVVTFARYQAFAESQDYGVHGERVRKACWGYLCRGGAVELREVSSSHTCPKCPFVVSTRGEGKGYTSCRFVIKVNRGFQISGLSMQVLPKLSTQTLQKLLTSDELWVLSEEKRCALCPSSAVLQYTYLII
jgi:hypothetical protein